MDLKMSNFVLEEAALDRVCIEVDPYNQESIDDAYKSDILCLNGSTYFLYPGKRVLLSSDETIGLGEYAIPIDHIGLVTLRSTFARLGLIMNTGIVDADFYGSITMSVFNCGQYTVKLNALDPIFQMHVTKLLEGTEQPYSGRYQHSQNLVQKPVALKQESDTD